MTISEREKAAKAAGIPGIFALKTASKPWHKLPQPTRDKLADRFPKQDQPEASAQAPTPDDFIPAPDGSNDFGEITPEMSKVMRRQAGMIRLTRGVQNANGTGYGMAHIEANHGDQIRGLGYKTIEAFVKEVASNFVEVWQASGTQLLVTAKDGRKDVMFIQLDITPEGDHYRVNSAFPVRQKDFESRKGMKLLWSGSEPQTKATGQPSAFAAGNAEKSSGAGPNAITQSVESVAQSPESGKAGASANPAYTVADAKAAEKQLAQQIGDRIDALNAPAVNKISAKFLPTMGLKPTASKERNKALVLDFTKVNPLAAAAEFGVDVPASIRGPLEAQMEGRLGDSSNSNTAAASNDVAQTPSPDDFIPAPDGSNDFGEITPEMSKAMRRQAGRIRLQRGNERFGLEHIEARHGDQIRALGFKDIPSFLADALGKIEAIWQPDKTSQLVVVQSEEKGKAAFIQLAKGTDESGDFYTVNTAFPTGKNYVEGKKGWNTLWSRVPVPADNTGKLPSFADPANGAGQQVTMESGQSDAPSVVQTPESGKASAQPANAPAFSRSKASKQVSNTHLVTLQQHIDAITENWNNAPEVIVARNMRDAVIPQDVRDYDATLKSQGATGEPRGFFYKGKAYLLSEQLASEQDATTVLFHEVLGHYGLRRVFGKELKPILQQIATMRRADVVAKAKEYGLDTADESQRLQAAEEVLAEMAQKTPEIGFVQRAIAAIRTWLRNHIPGFGKMVLTDAEIIQSFILPARRFVEGGGDGRSPRGGSTVFSMGRGQTETTAFKNWYGDWQNAVDGKPSTTKPIAGAAGQSAGRAADDGGRTSDVNALLRSGGVGVYPGGRTTVGRVTLPGASGPVDASGKPVVFYHGTRDDFNAFRTDHPNRKDKGWLGRGVYLTSDESQADDYAWAKRGGAGRNIMPLYAAVKNPFIANVELKVRLKNASQEKIDAFTQGLADQGYDGVILENEDGNVELVAFKPTQVKSAIGNNGNFDDTSPDIRFSRASPAGVAARLGDAESNASSAPSAFAHGTGPGISPGELAQVVEGFVGQFAHQAPVIVLDSAVGTLPGVSQGDAVAGAVHRGRIHLFLDQIPNRTQAVRTLWHEMLHYGLRRFLTKDQFIAQMLDLSKSDMWIRTEAKKWVNSVDGQKARSFGGDDYAMARGVDEALARLAEETQGGKESSVLRAMAFRKVVNWLAKLADLFNSPKMASYFRGMSNAEAKAYVRGVFQRLKDDAPATMDDWAFSAEDAFSREAGAKAAGNMTNTATAFVNDFMHVPGKLGWWHKTVGTQFNLAQRSPEFKRVFDAVQGFVNDVSFFATEAADMAPTILPKLENWRDIIKSPMSAEDTKAIAAPIFEGTLTWMRDESGRPVQHADMESAASRMTIEQKAQRLLRNDKVSERMLQLWQGLPVGQFESIINGKYTADLLQAGIVWTDAELKGLFKLTDPQIGLYREFRSATDRSLAQLAISDMLYFAGKDADPVRDVVLASKSVAEAAQTLSQYLLSLPDDAGTLADTANKVIDKADKAQALMDRGYAPLSRFGQYTLDVLDAGGDRVYFGLFESRLEAAQMARKMELAYPGAAITRGTLSSEAYKLFAGVSPETVELFGDMMGLESNAAYQEYIKLAKSSRSAMKRLIQRKGITGFSEDAGRVLAGFVYSNARQTSQNLHAGEMTEAAEAIPQGHGELKDAAVRLVDYIKNPQEEAQAIRGLMFAQYIGGSVASAMVNMTQPLTMTLPWLSQFGGITQAGRQMAAAMIDMRKRKTGDAALDAALKRAEEDGTVSPQEVHDLMRQAQGRGALQAGDGTKAGEALAFAKNSLSRVSFAWGKAFSMAEQINRRATFIAAYRTAVAQKMVDPDAFARRAIHETQGIYNKGNKPKWARGAVGSTLFTFKQYGISYVEMMHRMATRGGPEGKMAALYGLAILMLLSGVGGAPGADDLDDIISGALQAMGYNFDSKAARRAFLAEYLGNAGADFVERGVSGLPGVPIDVSGRLGLGNLIPGTGLLTKKQDHTRDVMELAGPAGDMAKRAFEAGGNVLKGDLWGHDGAVAKLLPKAGTNLLQAADMANMGMYRDQTGKKVVETGAMDAMSKALGFQPNDVKRVQDATAEVQRMVGLNKIREAEIADKWAMGLFEKDPEKVQAARGDLATWNADNPESPIRITFPQIAKRVHAMNMTKEERIAKTAPKEIRNQVRQALATP